MKRAHRANRTHHEHLRTVRTIAGHVRPGDTVRAPGGWADVTAANLAPDHAAVIVLTLDGDPKPRRYHCDEPVAILERPYRAEEVSA